MHSSRNSFLHSVKQSLPSHPCEQCPCGGGILWPCQCHALSLTPLNEETWHRWNVCETKFWDVWTSFARCEYPTSFCESLVASGLNVTEQLPSLHTETRLTKRWELGQRGNSWQTSHNFPLQLQSDNRTINSTAQVTVHTCLVFWAMVDSDD